MYTPERTLELRERLRAAVPGLNDLEAAREQVIEDALAMFRIANSLEKKARKADSDMETPRKERSMYVSTMRKKAAWEREWQRRHSELVKVFSADLALAKENKTDGAVYVSLWKFIENVCREEMINAGIQTLVEAELDIIGGEAWKRQVELKAEIKAKQAEINKLMAESFAKRGKGWEMLKRAGLPKDAINPKTLKVTMPQPA